MEQIKKAIEEAKRPTNYGGYLHVFNDKQLFDLLRMVGRDCWLEGNYNLAKEPTELDFNDYWQTLLNEIKQ